MAVQRLPFEIKNALINVCGRTFHWKRGLFEIFERAGIPRVLYQRYESLPKFTIARTLLADLEERGDEGYLMQRRLLTELCLLRKPPDTDVNLDTALAALRELKRLAYENDLVVNEERERTTARVVDTSSQYREQAGRLDELLASFREMFSSGDRQERGYDLEALLVTLFDIYGMRYRKSYRGQGEQIDGGFHFRGVDYIVEARWRQGQPTSAELLTFKGKVERKVEGTRGFFVSIMGFDPKDIKELREAGRANLVLMDGEDVNLILEARITLGDALQVKAEKAAQEGVLFFRLASLFAS